MKVIEGQPGELVKHIELLKNTEEIHFNESKFLRELHCQSDLVATMEGTGGDGGDVVLVQVQVLQLP